MNLLDIFVHNLLCAMELKIKKEKRGCRGTAYLTEQLHSRVSEEAKDYLDNLVKKSGHKPSVILDSMLLYFKEKKIEFTVTD